MTRVIAVDWSGKAKGAAESIWRAVVIDGHLVELENGLDRAEITEWIVEYAQRHPRTVVGLDFAFSFPAWFCERGGWGSGRDVWDSMRVRADELLDTCEPPFWGRAETKAQKLGHAFRQTELDVEGQPKSVFQIGGAGAVGTGSLRGMRHLAQLAEAGFAIWPFDEPGWPLVAEIYPRLLTPKGLVKSRHLERRAHLTQTFPDQNQVLLERAAGSEDAFDAAISALTMAQHLDELENPTRLTWTRWSPTTARSCSKRSSSDGDRGAFRRARAPDTSRCRRRRPLPVHQ
jgi:hypothetical protein